MHALAKASLGLLAAALLLAVPAGPAASQSPPPTATESAPVSFGMDAGSVSAQAAAGVKPDYGTFWIGPWTLSSGWGGPDAQLTAMKDAGVTPAIHFYYWGDDISPSCVENGCYSSLHKAQKDRAGWSTLSTQLTDHLDAKMAGKPVVIFLESEFNKGGIETYEPFDGYMEAMAKKIHAAYPNAIIVLGFGNWGQANWGNFDRAAGASDMVGIQSMRGSTRQSKTDMGTLYESLLAGAKTLGSKFPGKPIMVTDLAVSSYPEPEYSTIQRDVVKEVFDNLATLKAAGVQAIIYRSWKDSPTMDTANWYGMAERYWGFANANGNKVSAQAWIDGVKAERAGTGATPSASTTSSTTAIANRAPTAAFSAAASGLTVAFDGSGSSDPDGQALSYTWTFGDGAAGSGKTASHAYAAAGTHTVKLTVGDGSASSSVTRTVTVSAPYTVGIAQGSGANTFWVEVKASAPAAPAKVEVKAGDGAWKALRLRYAGSDTTTWGESIALAKGTPVQFRATATDGRVATTPTMAWLTTTSATASTTSGSTTTSASASSTSTAASTSSSATATSGTFSAKFSPKSVGNDWWIETAVSASQPVAKVEVKVGSGGTWAPMAKQDWGDYAKSANAPNGTYVQFRATSSSGATAVSPTYVWG